MIRTKRLLLRPARPDDLKAVHGFRSQDDAALYMPSAAATDIEQTRTWLANMIATPAKQGEDYLIELDGKVIGKVGAYRIPEIGYQLHPDYWGRGYASESLRALLFHLAQTRPEITELIADVDPRNDRSIALLERLGFEVASRAARTIETHIGWCDSIYFRIRRDEMLALMDEPT